MTKCHAHNWIGLLMSLLIILTALPFSAGAEADAASIASALAAEQAEKQTDPWVLAILQSGPRGASLQNGVLTFTLRSYDPDLKALGSYSRSEDPAAWRASMLAGMTSWNLSLSVSLEADGTPAKKSVTAMLKAVKTAAKNAKAAFSKKDVTLAIRDLLWCSPTDARKVTSSDLLAVTDEFAAFIGARGDLFPCELPAEWAPAFHLLKNWELKASKGPGQIILSWEGVPCETLISQAYDAAMMSLAGVSVTERLSRGNLPVLWRSELAAAAVDLAAGKRTDYSVVLDLDELAAGILPEGYLSFFSAYQPAAVLEKLTAVYDQLPAYACEDFPKAGVNTAASQGRSVQVAVEKNGRNTYVQFADSDTGVIRGDAFITPGRTVSVRIPEGTYVVRFAQGSAWYGLPHLFGTAGDYTASDPIIVAKTKWTLTAGQESEGFVLHEAQLADFMALEDYSVTIQASLEPTTPVGTYLEVNPVLPEINPYTGLDASGETYTPVVVVLDNAEEAYPHWGVSGADIIFQVPNAGAGATKLLALFTSDCPDQAGPVRSGRASMLPAVMAFDAAFAFAGPPAVSENTVNVNLLELMKKWGMTRSDRVYNLLNSDLYKERLPLGSGMASHNLSCHVSAIRDNLLAQETPFEIRSFLFADEPRTNGAEATNIRILHRGDDASSGSNSASRAVFNYDESTGLYTRTNSSGVYRDRTNDEIITFANVIVLRVQFNREEGYIYLKDHMTGSGSAEIFQNGRYVRGAWTRSSTDGRLVLADADGSELRMQRGRSFIIITNDISDVIYAP